MYVFVCICPWRPEASDLPGAEGTGNCEVYGARNQTLVLYKSSRCSGTFESTNNTKADPMDNIYEVPSMCQQLC